MNEVNLYDHDNLKCNWSNCWIWLYQADPVTCGSSEFRTLLSNCLAETTSQQLPIINYILCIQGDIDRCESYKELSNNKIFNKIQPKTKLLNKRANSLKNKERNTQNTSCSIICPLQSKLCFAKYYRRRVKTLRNIFLSLISVENCSGDDDNDNNV